MSRRQKQSLSVNDFFAQYGEQLALSWAGEPIGGERLITSPIVNRPGLALAGYVNYFAANRIQIFGTGECSYLTEIGEDKAIERLNRMMDFKELPCLIASRDFTVPERVIDAINARELSVLTTKMATTPFIRECGFVLEREFAEQTSLHGCMVDIRGIGVLIRGKSGAGKSEAVIGIIERGGGLIADDLVHVEKVSGRLLCTAPKLAQGFLEMRGIGIVNVANLFGLGAIEQEKELDLIITLRPATKLNAVDRLGIEREELKVLDKGVPHIELPVAPGRDIARLIQVAAMDFRLKNLGFDMGDEFNRRVRQEMDKDS